MTYLFPTPYCPTHSGYTKRSGKHKSRPWRYGYWKQHNRTYARKIGGDHGELWKSLPKRAEHWRSCPLSKGHQHTGTNSDSMKLRTIILIAIAAAVAFYTINYLVTPALVGPHKLEIAFRPAEQREFDQVVWRNTVFDDAARYQMGNYLVSQSLLHGWSEAKLSEQLGPPDIEQADSESNEKLWFYRLARQRSYPARSWLLPSYFANFDNWILVVVLRDRTVVQSTISF